MPSLRRSFSSPSVRPSPYPSSLSLSAYAPSPAHSRTSPFHPRRSSASATAERRVLADIEWWRVHDGQCDLDLQDPLHDHAHPLDNDPPPSGTVTLSAASEFDPLGFPMQSFSSDPFAALSIAPHSPSASSVESTPELSTTPLEFGLPDPVSSPFSDHITSFPLARVAGRQAHPMFGLRSVSAPGLSHQGSFEPYFTDIGGDPFSLDQNLFQ